MKKRIYSIIIAVVLMLSSIAAPTKVSALEIPYRVDVTKYTSDEANASAQIREQVKAHANTVTVYVRTKICMQYLIEYGIMHLQKLQIRTKEIIYIGKCQAWQQATMPLCVKRRETIHIIQNTQLM